MDVIIILIVLIAIGVGVYNLILDIRRKAEGTWASLSGDHEKCIYCKYCVHDEYHKISDKDYFCRLSRVDNINESTVMDCAKRPTVTEEDLTTLFALGIWTSAGQNYIRTELLNQKKYLYEIDGFLKELAVKHPDFIVPDAAERYANDK